VRRRYHQILRPYENQSEKTKVMCISRKGNCRMKILVDRQLVEQVIEVRYLGSLISEDEYCEKEIHNRIVMGKKIFVNKNRLFTGK